MTIIKPRDAVFKVLQENQDYKFTVTKGGFFSGRKVTIIAKGEVHTCKIGELFKKLDTEVKNAKNASRSEIQTLMDTRDKIASINKSPLSKEMTVSDGVKMSLLRETSSDVYGKRTRKIGKLEDHLWNLRERNTTPEEKKAMEAEKKAQEAEHQANMEAIRQAIKEGSEKKVKRNAK